MLESIRTIIVPTDFSALSEVALRTAARWAQQDSATLHLLHSIRLPVAHTNYDANVPQMVWDGLRKATLERMRESEKLLREAGVSQVEFIVTDAKQPAVSIEQAARDTGADLVVMATHGRRGFKHALLGSVTERTIRTSPIPVLAVKNDGVTPLPLRKILLASDFSTHSEKATELARTLGHGYGAHIDFVHVLDQLPEYLRYASTEAVAFDTHTRAMAKERVQELRDRFECEGLSVKSHLLDGIPAEVIAGEADLLGSDLIVMGTHGFTGFEHVMIGSVAEHALRLAPCSVLTTRAED